MLEYYQIYDHEYKFVNDIEFIESLMRSGASLEVGCGSGRVLEYLLNKNKYSLFGFDIDEDAMTLAANKFSKYNIDLTVDNAVSFSHPRKYQNILFLFNGLMHLGCEKMQLSFLKNSYDHLIGDGSLLLYVSNPDINRMSEKFPYYKYQKTLEIDGIIVDKFECNKYDLDNQFLHRIFNYDYVNQEGLLQRLTSRFTVRYLYKSEIERLLNIAGFKKIEIYGNFDGSQWASDSPHIIIHATK